MDTLDAKKDAFGIKRIVEYIQSSLETPEATETLKNKWPVDRSSDSFMTPGTFVIWYVMAGEDVKFRGRTLQDAETRALIQDWNQTYRFSQISEWLKDYNLTP